MQLRELERLFGAKFLDEFEFAELIVPLKMAPIIIENQGERVIKAMQFSLIPANSKDKKLKYSTHNAKIETISEKPTWRGPFVTKRCLAPMTEFFEPSYWGERAGNMLAFSNTDGLLAAAGIYEIWNDPSNGEAIYTFSLITKPAGEFVDKEGHDRQPIFLDQSGWNEWLRGGERSPHDLKEVLDKFQSKAEYTVRIDRAMKSGWEKRAEEHIKQRKAV